MHILIIARLIKKFASQKQLRTLKNGLAKNCDKGYIHRTRTIAPTSQLNHSTKMLSIFGLRKWNREDGICTR